MKNTNTKIKAIKDDYFAKRLLAKLNSAEPVFAAYEAQAVSSEVGFDFANFQDVVPRALDEIREAKEAFAEEGKAGREHFGDEIADIMFSLINLARHAGISDMPAINDLADSLGVVGTDINTIAIIDDIGSRISKVSKDTNTNAKGLMSAMTILLVRGLEDTILLATALGFNPEDLLRENVRKYLIRCQAIETLAANDNKTWADLASNNEIVAYWKKAKTILHNEAHGTK